MQIFKLWCIATKVSRPEILEILLDKGVKDPTLNNSLLNNAILSKNSRLVPLLLKHNETVTAANLNHACSYDFKPNLIKLLLDHISDQEFNSQNSGLYACHWMMIRSNPEVVEMFLEKGVDVNKLSRSGCTCVSLLKNSDRYKTTKILNLLEGHGFDVNLDCKTDDGTPTDSTLAEALNTIKINLVLIEWLLNHGARTDVIIQIGKMTIQEYVKRSRNKELINLFAKYA